MEASRELVARGFVTRVLIARGSAAARWGSVVATVVTAGDEVPGDSARVSASVGGNAPDELVTVDDGVVSSPRVAPASPAASSGLGRGSRRGHPGRSG